MDLTGITVLIIGIILGGVAVYALISQFSKDRSPPAEEMKDAFTALSMEALSKSTDEFLKLASETLKGQLEKGESTLEEKKKLIDTNLEELKTQLEGLTKQTTELKGQMEQSNLGVKDLVESTASLNRILSSSQARGQWGERMVSDILDHLGLKKGINYETQSGSREGKPDFTFFLPQGKRVNMDVKFPWDHYAAMFSTDGTAGKEDERKAFLKDVKGHIKTLKKRDYVDPAGGTLDFVLMFIPNEGIYAFLNKPKTGEENLVEFAMDNKVLLCSPITLFAILAMVRQSVQSFHLESRALEIQNLVQAFRQQWDKFVEKMDSMGKSLTAAQKHYDDLATTRRNQLEKPLDKIDDLQLGQDGRDMLPDESTD
ncbi:MAG: DNA recombination protein RmuC [Candidatus Marinimicrobia bacterium]|jgi:DNA recombination protein RmuC|nr:DNA recombination protein RmuC [Candidatus Neomarinimicrobiota bacterium]|tara:strand:- start:1166 stop:2278 length:1113 start_codon:yes stop_codon:yes gene_type:complete